MTLCNTVSYAQARDLIQDGDILSIVRPKNNLNPLSYLTTVVTDSPYYHSAIAVWMYAASGDRRLFVVEAHAGKRRIVPASIYENFDFDVLAKPKYVSFDKFSEPLLANVGRVNYGYLDFISIGIKELLKLPAVDHKGEVCSEMCAKMWEMGGLSIADTLLSPGELDKVLTTVFSVKYRCKVMATVA